MNALSKKLQAKLDSLISFIKDKSIIVAFSGGVDSALLAYLVKQHAKEHLVVLIENALTPDTEIQNAKKFAEKQNICLKVINANILDNEQFAKNPQNRCYICKDQIFQEIIKVKEELKYDIVVEGSNADDLDDYRPGMKALEELGVESPYIEFNINKSDIRDLSRYYGLPTASKPSMACLASRVSIGQTITKKKLRMIEQAESYLKKMFTLSQVRVRLHENLLARIEFEKSDLPHMLHVEKLSAIKDKLKNLGFLYITVDLNGYQSGSMNITKN
ncbi:MAG: ATP-dependent sacrificial sulfur transferase LarE [Promethearchaeia archaeon]